VALKRMDNVGIVVEDLGGAINFFCELGLELEGRTTIEGEWAGRVTGLGDQSVEIAMMRTPDGHSRLELSHFLTPPVVADHRNSPGQRSRLPPRHVCRGRRRRDSKKALRAWGAARR
jgi:catechol 2,3-dioxygenase-like lactoylglutathione lyase family enzyme